MKNGTAAVILRRLRSAVENTANKKRVCQVGYHDVIALRIAFEVTTLEMFEGLIAVASEKGVVQISPEQMETVRKAYKALETDPNREWQVDAEGFKEVVGANDNSGGPSPTKPKAKTAKKSTEAQNEDWLKFIQSIHPDDDLDVDTKPPE